MTKGEIRYFKLLNSKYKKRNPSNTVILFEAIKKMDDATDDEVLKLHLSKNIRSNLAYEKHKLYKQLRESLVLYRSRFKSNHEDGYELYKFCEILYNKNLVDECFINVEKGIKIASEKEDLLLKNRFYLLKRKLCYLNVDEKDNDFYKSVENLSEKIRECIEMNSRIEKLVSFEQKIFLIIKGFSEVKNEDQIITDFESLNKKFLSKKEEIQYHRLSGFYYIFLNKLEESANSMKMVMLLLEKNDCSFFDLEAHLKSYFNYLSVLLEVNKEHNNESLTARNKIFNIDVGKENRKLKYSIDIVKMTIRISEFLIEKNYKAILELANEYDNKITEAWYRIFPNVLDQSIYILAYVSFGYEKYDLSLRYVEGLLKKINAAMIHKRHISIRFMNIILQYELGNYFVINSLCDSLRYHLNSKNILNKEDKFILSWIKTNLSKPNLNIEQRILRIKSKLEGNQNINSTSLFYGKLSLFDLMAWINSKIQNRPMIEFLVIEDM